MEAHQYSIVSFGLDYREQKQANNFMIQESAFHV